MKTIRCATAVAALALVLIAPARGEGVPEFRVDPFWPKPLPNHWIFGQIGGIALPGDLKEKIMPYRERSG